MTSLSIRTGPGKVELTLSKRMDYEVIGGRPGDKHRRVEKRHRYLRLRIRLDTKDAIKLIRAMSKAYTKEFITNWL